MLWMVKAIISHSHITQDNLKKCPTKLFILLYQDSLEKCPSYGLGNEYPKGSIEKVLAQATV